MPLTEREPLVIVKATLFALVLIALSFRVAAADEVTSKGTVLHGKVTGMSGSGITFEPEYGKGSLDIKWEDIENIKTDGALQVLYADQETYAPVQGLRDGKLLVGESAESAAEIDTATLESATPVGEGGPSFHDRMRSTWRYWDGNFDLGFNLQRATTDTTGVAVAFKTTRSKAPTRLTFSAAYRYAKEKPQDEDEHTTQDQALGLIRGEYDFTKRFFAFASFDALYDAIQDLSIRAVPKAGVGYVLWEQQIDADRRNFLSADIGPGWVYEKFFGGEDDSFFTIGLGASAGIYLPYGSKFDWRFDYLPAIDDFSDYLIRNEAGLSVPLWDPISAKVALLDEYDSTPAEDADKNSLYLLVGASIGW